MTRVRFAPSPTGLLHIGNARTALFNWLFARHSGGSFILRIEDTDIARSDPRYTQQIIEDLRWLGLDWQEGPDIGGAYGPYLQSQRLGLYQESSKRLLDSGKAYPCYCTPGELESRRQASRAKGKPPRYDNRCRNLSEKEKRAFDAEGRRPSLRFMIPDKRIVLEDIIRGKCEFNMALFGDFVLMKADGTPSFHLAVAVDDSLMKITHVIRGEDHLTNTPLHLLLFETLGYEPPHFAHLPLIAGEEGLLSKRQGAFSIKDYRERGYLPEALVNYMLLLGWSTREKREKFSQEEAIERFELNHVSRSPSTFDEKKLDWLAGQYLRQADIEWLTELA
ncbi:MAG: glutamate--tRNA ligase, partial [Candidatus Brocadiales bacterium]|nr:glutamate--tRNA ligase [Candidatus Brocadiales bacterium]